MCSLWSLHALLLLMYFRFVNSQNNSSSIFDIGSTNNTSGCVQVPYPFGPPGEALSGFEVVCTNSSHENALGMINTASGMYLLQNISLRGQVTILTGLIYEKCYYGDNENESSKDPQDLLNLEGTPYTISKNYTTLVAVGCDDVVTIEGVKSADQKKNLKLRSGCVAFCGNLSNIIDGSCSGFGCCQAPIPVGLKRFNLQLNRIQSMPLEDRLSNCSSAFFATKEGFSFKTTKFENNAYFGIQKNNVYYGGNYEVVLDWAIGNKTCREASKEPNLYACKENTDCYDSPNGAGYLCNCSQGFEGNPYLPNGCKDIDECGDPETNTKGCIGRCINKQGSPCACRTGMSGDGCENVNEFRTDILLGVCLGLLFLMAMVSLCSYWRVQKRKIIKMRSEYFRQNGGWILRERLVSHGIDSTTRIFTTKELQNATDNYCENRILGSGGYGTVYKGVLSDQRLVAIKRSKIIDEGQVEQFINEITILSQVNHRNVVKLIGCCLETEVPLLVYEFISNGTLFEHIHRAYPLPWEYRLRISRETANAVAYLHSAASFPIIHRDIKSSNILLDENFAAKVSDFGASRSVPFDRTHVTTLVQGTLGYLDPEYFYTGQLTEKSDVYSFGVVLAELLTGEMPISVGRAEDSCNLATYFTTLVDERRLVRGLEPRILEEAKLDDVHLVANLAKRCMNVKGEDRPTMKEVSLELEGLRKVGKKCTSEVAGKEVVQEEQKFIRSMDVQNGRHNKG